jgi:hypothetical protein
MKMTFVEQLTHMCSRPQMYVRSGSFSELVCFLDGYDCAMHQFAPEEFKTAIFHEFGRWLSRTHESAKGIWIESGEEVANNFVWSSKFQRLYPSDGDAFEALPRLYQSFLDDRQTGA